jgi:hypothetical protein
MYVQTQDPDKPVPYSNLMHNKDGELLSDIPGFSYEKQGLAFYS